MATGDNSEPMLTRRNVVSTPKSSFYADHEDMQEQTDHDSKDKGVRVKKSPYTFVNFMWIAAAIGVLYYTNIAFEAFTNGKVDRWWFDVGCILIGINVSICSFLIIYVSYIKKIDSDLWETEYPVAIPVATASFALGSFCWNVAFWPLWSFLTPVFLFVVLMGFVVIVCMLPAF